MSFDWKGTIGKIAPALAGMFGSPVAGVAVGALCNALGLEPSPENAQKAAEQFAAGQMTGEQLVALRKAELDAQTQLKKMGMEYDVKREELIMTDRAGARAREIAIKDKIPAVLAIGVTVGFFSLLFYLLKWAPPTDNKDVLNIMLGSLGTAWISVISYYFGASSGDAATKVMLHKSKPTDGGE